MYIVLIFLSFISASEHFSHRPHMVGAIRAVLAYRFASKLQECVLQALGARLGSQGLRGAGSDDSAVVYDRDILRDLLRFFHIVSGEKYRRAVGSVELFEIIPHAVSRLRIKADGWLIEEDHRRMMQKPARDLQSPFHSAGKCFDQAVLPVPKLHESHELFYALAPLLSRYPVKHAVEFHVLPGGQFIIKRRVLEDDAEGVAHIIGILGKVEIVERNMPACRLQKRGQHLDRRGLPRAVRPEECEYLAILDRKRNIFDRRNIAEFFYKIFDLYHMPIISQKMICGG